MGSLTIFLGLCLIEGFYAARLTSASALVNLDGTTQDGAAVAIPDLQWESGPCLEDSQWRLSTWVRINVNTAENARLLQITGFSEGIPTTCYVTWTSTNPVTFTCGTTGHPVTGAVSPSNRQTKTWAHLTLSSSYGTTFGALAFRSESNSVFFVSWAETVIVTRATSIMAPANANPFYVFYT